MAEDPKEFLKKCGAVLKDAAKRCFYYPACGLDFVYPLQHFSKWCDKFIFCDWMVGDRSLFLDQINTIKVERPEGVTDVTLGYFDRILFSDDVKKLANMEVILAKFFPEMPSNLRRFLADGSPQEKQFAEVWITTSGGEKKFVQVLWLGMEGVNIYWKLFAQRGIAPLILCIKKGRDGHDKWWTPFEEWHAHLGQVVQGGHSEPKFLVARKDDHNWPWALPVAEFGDWDDQPVMMWARE